MTDQPMSEVPVTREEPWQVFRDLCTPAAMWHDEEGWRLRADAMAEALARLNPPVSGDVESMLNDLLAVVHRDGGHRQAEVGQEQAWMEAMMTVPFMIEAQDRLKALSHPADGRDKP